MRRVVALGAAASNGSAGSGTSAEEAGEDGMSGVAAREDKRESPSAMRYRGMRGNAGTEVGDGRADASGMNGGEGIGAMRESIEYDIGSSGMAADQLRFADTVA